MESDHAGPRTAKMAIVFALAEQIVEHLRDSGATEEEAQAALSVSESILPLLELQSRNRMSMRT
jgi:hypothetical protein